MKQVQISEELFSRLYGFHVLGKQDALQGKNGQNASARRVFSQSNTGTAETATATAPRAARVNFEQGKIRHFIYIK